ncbi:metallophosphoesterase [Anatilimnocola floriformis]|uniref:metallophosphoesterase n=1 Tax=Anatilimnocola floriformis TaxID=2948575 RepID=UPI0020C21B5C|nr:metallophosphoesterase [Anatilimnocola floriformis]
MLRIIGDVHAQIGTDDLLKHGAQPYLELIAEVEHSVQIGDMGDGIAYEQLIAGVDSTRHRFFPGNHDHYHCLPPHSLGDFGPVALGGVEFFFIRGAASTDREKLLRVGRELGRTLWFAEEELSIEQMQSAAAVYTAARPTIMLTHDAPTEIAQAVWEQTPQPLRRGEVFAPSRTNTFLEQLLAIHQPRLWLFGHHHRDWRYRAGPTLFGCVGELSYVDITADGDIAAR